MLIFGDLTNIIMGKNEHCLFKELEIIGVAKV